MSSMALSSRERLRRLGSSDKGVLLIWLSLRDRLVRLVKPETAEKLKDLIKEMEDAVYTGKGDNVCSLVDEIPEHINRIEKEIW